MAPRPCAGLAIRDDVSASELRRLAVREAERATARRMMAIANALECMPRAEAACNGAGHTFAPVWAAMITAAATSAATFVAAERD